MATKKLINSPSSCVDDCLQGYVYANPGVRLLEGHRVVVRSDIDALKKAGKVALLSGGGSGHEPAHAGYVGPGMLSGAVAGDVFSSPPPDTILAAIRHVGTNNLGGVLLIVKNYTGDRLNFGLAAERAKAEGIDTEMVVVGDDCALTSLDKTAGRRGLCGTIFIHKIAGAMSECGSSLHDIASFTKEVAKNIGTISVSLSPCSLPGHGPSFHLEHDEMELGLGIHGEAGVQRLKLQTSKKSVKLMIDHMINPQSGSHFNLKQGGSVALIVNNLGGTSMLELNIMAKEAMEYLESKGAVIDRAYLGTFMTSLEMAGASLSLLHLDDKLKNYLDAYTSAPSWMAPLLPQGIRDRCTPTSIPVDVVTSDDQQTKVTGNNVDEETGQLIYDCLKQICNDLISSEEQLNLLDTGVGDGDCGSTLKRGCDAVIESLGPQTSPGLSVKCPYELLLSLAHHVEHTMGGSSGGLYSLFLSAGTTGLLNDTTSSGWLSALDKGILAIMKYGGAAPGDRTMLDALVPCKEALDKALKSGADRKTIAKHIVEATEKGAASTAHMKAAAGRASYVTSELVTQADPGAQAVSIWIGAIAKVLMK